MTLATSCPSCGTVFKVIEDQLKVSEGWVRCGHCHSVFNALEGLFDLGTRSRSAHSRPMAPEGLASGAGRLSEQMPSRPLADPPAAAPAVVEPVSPPPPARITPDRPVASAVATSGLAEPSGFGPSGFGASAWSASGFGSARSAVPLDPVAAAPVASTASPSTQDLFQEPAPTESSVSGPVHERHERDAIREVPPLPADYADGDTVFLAHEPFGIEDDALLGDRPGEVLAREGAAHAEPAFGTLPGQTASADDEPGLDPLAAGFDARSGDAAANGNGAWSDPQAEFNSSDTAPSFVRHADRAAWWGRPVVRAALLVGCLLAAAGLLLQLGLMRRDLLAAQSPLARSLLEPACEALGCVIEPPRLLDALAVENSNMVKLSGIDGYRLQLLLRNRASHEVRAPHVELSLTDAAGGLVVRRVLQPADFRQPELLAAEAEGNWQLDFASTDRRVAGYTVAIFYP